MLLNCSVGSREALAVCASYLAPANEQARQESLFHHLIQKQSENEGRSEIVVLLNHRAKSSGSPWSAFSWIPLPLHCPVSPSLPAAGRDLARSPREIPPGAPAEAESSHVGPGRAGTIPPCCSPGTSIVQVVATSWLLFSEWLQDVVQNWAEIHPMHLCTWHGKELKWCSRGTALQVKQSEALTCWELYRNLAGARTDCSYSWNRRYLIKWLVSLQDSHVAGAGRAGRGWEHCISGYLQGHRRRGPFTCQKKLSPHTSLDLSAWLSHLGTSIPAPLPPCLLPAPAPQHSKTPSSLHCGGCTQKPCQRAVRWTKKIPIHPIHQCIQASAPGCALGWLLGAACLAFLASPFGTGNSWLCGNPWSAPQKMWEKNLRNTGRGRLGFHGVREKGSMINQN